MPVEQILTNVRIITAEQEFVGTLVLCDGLIAQVEEGVSGLPQAQNLNGDYLLPGLVELHTDNLEKYMSPRPGVDWPSASAVLTHDAQIASAQGQFKRQLKRPAGAQAAQPARLTWGK